MPQCIFYLLLSNKYSMTKIFTFFNLKIAIYKKYSHLYTLKEA